MAKSMKNGTLAPPKLRLIHIVLLAEAFLRRYGQRSRPSALRLSEDGKIKLKGYDWPGNIRELENVIERAVITSKDGRTLNLDRALPDQAPVVGESMGSPQPQGDPDRVFTATEMQDLERRNILRALEAAKGKISGQDGAAERLGLNPNTLTSRMRVLGIKRPK
jgi:transcriptional regulator with GAF, ATPase, and Fis domain